MLLVIVVADGADDELMVVRIDVCSRDRCKMLRRMTAGSSSNRVMSVSLFLPLL